MYFLRQFLYTRRRHITSSTGAGDKRYVSTIAINNMIIQRFIKYGYFEQYKAYLYNRKIRLVYRRYSEVQKQYKEFFFYKMKEDFTKLLDSDRLDEALECLYPFHKAIFEDVVYSKDFEQFQKWDPKRFSKIKILYNVVKKVDRKMNK